MVFVLNLNVKHAHEVGEIKYADVTCDRDGRSRGFGVVDFARKEDAEKALVEYNGAKLLGREIHLKEVRSVLGFCCRSSHSRINN